MKISKVDYLIVECGYTSRLEQHVDDIHKYFNDECDNNNIKVLFIKDRIWGSGLVEYNEHNLHTEFTNRNMINEETDGTICFKVSDLRECYDVMSHLMEYHHCGFFNFGSLCEMENFDYNGKNVMKFTFDTESG